MRSKVIIIIFMCMLILPGIVWKCVGGYVSKGTSENRALAQRPELELTNISEYPAEFESYYEDHLPFKNLAVHYNTEVNYKLFGEVQSDKVILGKDTWLFFKGEPTEGEGFSPIASYQGTNLYTKDELNFIKGNIDKTQDYFDKKGIEFSILICPDKEYIYDKYLPDSLSKVGESRGEQLSDFLYKNVKTKVFYPYSELMKLRDDYQLYYKYDTHWNSLGAYVANQDIREYYFGEKDSLDQMEVKVEKGRCVKDLAMMLDLEDDFTDDFYYVSNYKNDIDVQVVEFSDDGGFTRIYHSNAGNGKTALVLRDSYGEALCDYMTKDYTNTVVIHRDVFNAEDIEKYSPDIVIYECAGRTTSTLGSLCNIFNIE